MRWPTPQLHTKKSAFQVSFQGSVNGGFQTVVRVLSGDQIPLPPFNFSLIGDKFGESLVGSQAPPSFWEVPRTSPEVPRTSPEVFGDFPGSSLTVELYSNPGVPRKFPRLPRKFPKLPRKFPKLPRKFAGFPRRSALSLGSLTPSPDSQKLPLI